MAILPYPDNSEYISINKREALASRLFIEIYVYVFTAYSLSTLSLIICVDDSFVNRMT